MKKIDKICEEEQKETLTIAPQDIKQEITNLMQKEEERIKAIIESLGANKKETIDNNISVDTNNLETDINCNTIENTNDNIEVNTNTICNFQMEDRLKELYNVKKTDITALNNACNTLFRKTNEENQ